MKKIWDERYSNEAFAFGENPNEFLKETLPQFIPEKALFAAEGEGSVIRFIGRKEQNSLFSRF